MPVTRYFFWKFVAVFFLLTLSACSVFSFTKHENNYYFEHSKVLLESNDAASLIGQLMWPVSLKTLTSRYGPRKDSFHDGVDIRAPYVERVKAAHDGMIIRQDQKFRGYGKLLVLRGHDIVTFYGHLDDYVVQIGDTVKKGDVIGFVGSTGRSTGPHLHFETRIFEPDRKWFAIDPMVFFDES